MLSLGESLKARQVAAKFGKAFRLNRLLGPQNVAQGFSRFAGDKTSPGASRDYSRGLKVRIHVAQTRKTDLKMLHKLQTIFAYFVDAFESHRGDGGESEWVCEV